MFLKRIKITVTALLICSSAVIAQKAEPYRNELGIDVANIITFLSKKSESYLINYKRHISDKYSLRTGLNMEWSSSEDGYRGAGLKTGLERRYAAERWRLHWGADATFRCLANNFQSNKSCRCGVSPVIGFSYFPVDRFSISTEISLNFFYTENRNSASFDPNANANVWDINIGSVGMLVVAYHF